MADVIVDWDGLRTLSGQLKTVSIEFQDANTRSDGIADAVGHAGLAGAVRHFAHGWDDRRAEMVEAIAYLSDATAGVAEAFEMTDKDLAAAMDESGSAPPTTATRGPVVAR